MQAYHAAAPFARLLWAEAQGGVESQLALQARLACSQAALLALKLDAVRKRRLFQVRPHQTHPGDPPSAARSWPGSGAPPPRWLVHSMVRGRGLAVRG